MRGILTDENGDLMVQNGRLADCTQRILEAYPGEFKASPMLGSNVRSMLNGSPDPFWIGNANRQLQSQRINADINFVENRIEVRISE